MPSQTLNHDQASELYARLSREAAARNARRRRLRIVTRSGVVVAALSALTIGAGFATNWGQSSSPYPRLHPTKSTASAEAIRKAGRFLYTQLLPGQSFVWEPPLKSFGNPMAVAVSLTDAKARAPFPVETPSSVLPDSSIGKVWVIRYGPHGVAVAIEYEHLEILEETTLPSYDGPAIYRAMVQQQASTRAGLGGVGLRTVKGSTAFSSPPHSDDNGIPHPGYVVFMNGDVQITVMGYYPLGELIEIANSLSDS